MNPQSNDAVEQVSMILDHMVELDQIWSESESLAPGVYDILLETFSVSQGSDFERRITSKDIWKTIKMEGK